MKKPNRFELYTTDNEIFPLKIKKLQLDSNKLKIYFKKLYFEKTRILKLDHIYDNILQQKIYFSCRSVVCVKLKKKDFIELNVDWYLKEIIHKNDK